MLREERETAREALVDNKFRLHIIHRIMSLMPLKKALQGRVLALQRRSPEAGEGRAAETEAALQIWCSGGKVLGRS